MELYLTKQAIHYKTVQNQTPSYCWLYDDSHHEYFFPEQLHGKATRKLFYTHKTCRNALLMCKYLIYFRLAQATSTPLNHRANDVRFNRRPLPRRKVWNPPWSGRNTDEYGFLFAPYYSTDDSNCVIFRDSLLPDEVSKSIAMELLWSCRQQNITGLFRFPQLWS